MPTKVACHSCARFRRTSFLTTEARDRIRGSISLSSFAPHVSDCVMSRQRRRHSMVRGYEIGERPAVAMPSRTTHAGAHPFRARSLSVSRGRPHALSVPRTGAAHSIEKREPGARPFGPHVQFECVTAFSSDCSAARGRKPSWLMTSIGRVDDWRGGGRRGISVSAPFGSRCPTSHAVAPFPVAAHRTGRADFPHPALGQDLTPSPTARHAPSARGVRDPWSRRDRREDSPHTHGAVPCACCATTGSAAPWCSCRSPDTLC